MTKTRIVTLLSVLALLASLPVTVALGQAPPAAALQGGRHGHAGR